MDIILKATLNGNHNHFPADTTVASPEPSPTDPWLFTDPCARSFYREANLIDQLEEDIRTYVMFDGAWAPEELQYKREVRRLLQEGIIAPVDSFGSLSPHPTVYRILKVGALLVSGQRYAFEPGEDLVFEPWLARYSDPGLKGPLRTGQLYDVDRPSLCCHNFPNLSVLCDNTLALMRQILGYRKKK